MLICLQLRICLHHGLEILAGTNALTTLTGIGKLLIYLGFCTAVLVGHPLGLVNQAGAGFVDCVDIGLGLLNFTLEPTDGVEIQNDVEVVREMKILSPYFSLADA